MKKCCKLWPLFFLMLTGCMNATVTGAQAAYGRHSLQNSINDQCVNLRADHAIHWDTDHFKDMNISVATFNNIVLITGQVPNQTLHDELTKRVKDVARIDEIYNQTTIGTSASTITHMSDAWITTKIKSLLIANNDIDPSQIKVITENGTVFLMGIVPPEQADSAIEIARGTSGVQQVIKVFSYIHISKT